MILNLGNKQIGDEGLKQICNRESIQQYTTMLLYGNLLSYKGMETFTKYKWDKLEQLNLNSNFIRSLGCKYLSRASFKNLRQLVLTNNEVGSEGLAHLSKAKWRSIQKMYFVMNHFCAGGLKQLVRSSWSCSVELNLRWCEISFQDMLDIVLLPNVPNVLNLTGNRADDKKMKKMFTFLKQKDA